MTVFGRRYLPLALLVCLIGALADARPAAGQSHKRVLLLFDEDKALPGLAVLDQTIRSTLGAGLADDVEFFTESMNASQFPAPEYDRVLRDYYAAKYGDRKLDLMIGVMGPAVAFLRRFADQIAPGVPVVFCGADARDLAGGPLPPQMTGLIVRRVFGPTLEIALRLQPDTLNVFVVGGTSSFDRGLQAAARADLQPFEKRVTVRYLTDLSMSDLIAAVSRLPPHSVILYLTVFRDATGKTFVPHDVVSRISAAASVPVYVFLDQYMGLGPVGGYLYSVELHGRAAAELGLRLLRGESPATIPVREVPDNHYMFDFRELERWNLDSRLLPAGSTIEYREPAVWDRYRGYIIVAGVLFGIQTAFIVGLLVQRERRRRAEGKLLTSFERIREMGGRLLKARETERTRIAQELHDDIGQQLVLLKLNLYKLTGMVQGGAEAIVGETQKYANGIVAGVRDLSHRLYPARLGLVGLVAALEGLVRDLSHHSPNITFTHENVPPRLMPDLTLCLFRIAQEALQNSLKHGHAENVSVRLHGEGQSLTLTVTDDGVGFVVDAVWGEGLGLISMGERAEAFGGTFKVRSRPGRGTRVEISVPLDEQPPSHVDEPPAVVH
jgi:signal transduction histidine kinase